MEEYGFIPLSDIASSACDAIEDYEEKLKRRFLEFGYDYLDKLKLTAVTEVKTIELPMNDIHFVPFPRDYVRFTKIGTKLGGMIRLFTVSDRVATGHQFECGNYLANAPMPEVNNIQDVPFPFYNYTNAIGTQTPLFGYGLGIDNAKYVRIDNVNRGLQFAPTVDAQMIYLEYIANSFVPNEHTFVPSIAKRACRDYMLRQHHLFKGDNKNFRLMDEEYTIERRNVNKAFRGLSVQDIIHYSMRGFKQSAKNSL